MSEDLIEENAAIAAENQTAGAFSSPAELTNQTQTNEAAVGAAVGATTATIKIEGQEFALDAEIAEKDEWLKTALSPHYPSIKNANITRETGTDGRMIVQIVKRAEHKGKREK